MSDDFIHSYLYLCAIGGSISGAALLVYLVWAWFWWKRQKKRRSLPPKPKVDTMTRLKDLWAEWKDTT